METFTLGSDMGDSLTIREVAQIAGVSIATVSRAVNRSGPVSREARDAINRAIEQSGFRPNNIGRQLKTARTHTIGVLVPSLKNPIFADALTGLEDTAGKAGYNVLLAASGYCAEKEVSAVETFLRSRVEGMVLTVADETRSRALDILGTSGIPYVLLFNPAGRVDVSSVSVDNRLAAYQLVESLIGLGHERITMIAGRLSESDRSVERQAGYLRALNNHGLPEGDIVEVGFENPDLASRVAELEQRRHPPSAYFCSTDMLAIAMIRALSALGKRVPDDASVVGFDGIAIGEHLTPSLATAVQPAEAMGDWAARHLLARIVSGESIVHQVFPHRIRSGESRGLPGRAFRRANSGKSSDMP
ncbi:MAG: LacI family DNA-binding transcriptional regulator [Proteobacteria bacterium]|nr:MAG: LacI family DNA-binding transcriptional regulator [Pseudomonadota bacterium]